MKPLLAIHTLDGRIDTCDSSCHYARTANADCLCTGANRGLGRDRARANTLHHWPEWIQLWQRQNPSSTITLIDLSGLATGPPPDPT